jgi:hypothetical protein
MTQPLRHHASTAGVAPLAGNYPPVLILNPQQSRLKDDPIGYINWQDAMRMLHRTDGARVEMVAPSGLVIPAGRGRCYALPSIVALKTPCKPKDWCAPAPYNRHSVFVRDRFTCVLSGVRLRRRTNDTRYRASLDHLWPRFAGGPDAWENALTMSAELNSRKSNHPPRPTSEGIFVRIGANEHQLMLTPWVPTLAELTVLELAESQNKKMAIANFAEQMLGFVGDHIRPNSPFWQRLQPRYSPELPQFAL